ncbi:hypothetical protein BZA77DRAFT_295178 [Pyronema omphalodes]|nr:hypothetical protein BZA77DRAFT_295178 [Pyronema omphalodes]
MPRRTSIGLPSPLNPHQSTVKKSEYDWLFRPTPSLRSQRRDLTTSTLHIFALERQSPIPIYGLNISGLIPIDADHDVYKILRQISVATSPINLLNDDLDEYQLGALCDAFEICLDIFEEACKQEVCYGGIEVFGFGDADSGGERG